VARSPLIGLVDQKKLLDYNNLDNIYSRRNKLITLRREAMPEQTIISDPTIMMGKPIIAGTRITVEHVLDKLAAGETVEQIVDAHPRLTREAVFAAIAYAAEVLKSEIVYPIDEAAA
jgi:uncharacterized protein (DUF433 family)